MTWTPPPPRAGHPYYMHDAIYAQPGALRLVTRGQGDLIAGAASRLRAMDRVLLSGIGTSWHATLVGELLLAHVARLGHRVRALHSFEFKGYWPDPDARTGVVVVSHRGSKRYSVEALAKARAGGGVGVAITGKGAEGLASADYVLRPVDRERSAAHRLRARSGERAGREGSRRPRRRARAGGRSRDRALGRGDDRDPAGERAPLADPHRCPAPTLHLPPGAAAGGEPRHDAGRPARARPGARGTHALGSSKGASAAPSEPPPGRVARAEARARSVVSPTRSPD